MAKIVEHGLFTKHEFILVNKVEFPTITCRKNEQLIVYGDGTVKKVRLRVGFVNPEGE